MRIVYALCNDKVSPEPCFNINVSLLEVEDVSALEFIGAPGFEHPFKTIITEGIFRFE